jgi:hypothetical protein
MIFKFNNKNKSCDIIFSWKEILTLILKRKIYLDAEGFKKFSRNLLTMVTAWHWEEFVENNKKNKIIDKN